MQRERKSKSWAMIKRALLRGQLSLGNFSTGNLEAKHSVQVDLYWKFSSPLQFPVYISTMFPEDSFPQRLPEEHRQHSSLHIIHNMMKRNTWKKKFSGVWELWECTVLHIH